MASGFFSGLVKGISSRAVQAKQQQHEDDMAQQQAYLSILSSVDTSDFKDWPDAQKKAYFDAIGGAADVKSQKGSKGAKGLFGKLTGKGSGGSNLSEKLQQVFSGLGGQGSQMQQTSEAGQPAAEPGRARSVQDPNTDIGGTRTNFPNLPGLPVPPMPESFQRRQTSTGGGKTVRGGAMPAAPPLRLGGAKPQLEYLKDLVDEDGNTVGVFMNHKTNEITRIPYGPGMDSVEARQLANQQAMQARQIAVNNAKDKAKTEGKIDEMVRIQMSATPGADPNVLKQQFSQEYVNNERAKMQVYVDKHNKLIEDMNNAGIKIQQEEQRIQLAFENTNDRREKAYYDRSMKSLKPQMEQLKSLYAKVSDGVREIAKLRDHVPDPLKNPKDTQAAKEHSIEIAQGQLDDNEKAAFALQTAITALQNEANYKPPALKTPTVPQGKGAPKMMTPPAKPLTSSEKDKLFNEARKKDPTVTREEFDAALRRKGIK